MMSSKPARPDQPRTAQSERRAHARYNAVDLPTIRVSRLKHGPAVDLIDLSIGGALIEAGVQLKPGSSLALEIAAAGEDPAVVAMRVLRCEVSTLRSEAAVYRGACAFVHPLELPMLMAEPRIAAGPRGPFIGLDASLKLLAERCRHRSAAETLTAPEVIKILRTLQTRAAQLDDTWLAEPIADLLPMVVSALEDRENVSPVLSAIESRLRVALPQMEIRLTDAAPATGTNGARTILFRPDHVTDLPCVFRVQLPAGKGVTDWQNRLLNASMHLCSLLDATGARNESASATEPAPAAESGPAVESAWQKIVVRYKDGRLVKGFSHDFHPTRPQFGIWPAIDAPKHEGVRVAVADLKAVFFVRDFRGNAAHVDEKSFDRSGPGRRVEVTFFDNEVLVGTTLTYRPEGQGFFVLPSDRRSNNVRVFVVAAAVRRVRFVGSIPQSSAARPLELAHV
jgi:uncharacterized protein DUF6982/PilZ domain-containing protein